jgi:hypothetical protein
MSTNAPKLAERICPQLTEIELWGEMPLRRIKHPEYDGYVVITFLCWSTHYGY